MRVVSAVSGVMVKELIRKKDFYVFLGLLTAILGFLSFQSFSGIGGVSRYIEEIGYTLVMLFVFIIAVTFSAKQIPDEIRNKTIYPLLAKPVSRGSLIFAKYAGSVLVSSLSFLVLYCVYAFFCINSGGGAAPVLYAQGLFLGECFVLLSCAMAMFFSVFLTFSANVTLSFLVYFTFGFFAEPIREAVLRAEGAAGLALSGLYYLIPHFDLYDIKVRLAHSWPPVPLWVLTVVGVYTALYCFLLLFVSEKIFSGRRL
ncbi:MAG: ABC transporter permease subunit [Candidatus Omnitrophica bacterium]|nr:ABC transporter permease subunit [Candidatus Omnitrophota bacterium]